MERLTNILSKLIKGDRIIWGIIIALLMISIVIVYSATGTLAFLKSHNTSSFIIKRVGLIAFCGIIMITISHIHYKFFSTLAGVVLLFGCICLIALPFVGIDVNGSKRWLPILGFTIQPSELVKIGLIMYTCKILAHFQGEKNCTDSAFKHIVIVSGIALGLIFISDFSSSAILGLTIMIICIVGRVRMKLLGKFIGVMFIALMLFVASSFVLPMPNRIATIQNRVLSYMGMNSNETSNDTYKHQIDQSKIAIATGGYIGLGIGKSVQRNFLPLAFSDFIFAIIVEEGGLITGLFVLLLYLILMYRAGKLVYRSTKVFPALLTFGLTLGIVFQALINIGVAVGFFPITGQPLPLVSMGGSSLLFTCISFGMILSVTNSIKEEEKRIIEQHINE